MNWLTDHNYRIPSYGVVVAVSVAILGFTFRHNPFAVSGAYSTGIDATWFLAQFVSVDNVGPFLTDPHLNWPIGLNTWSYPVAGLFILIAGWLLSYVPGLQPMGIYELVFVAVVVADALATLYLFRSVSRRRFRQLSVVFALVVAVGPFVFYRFHHLNVSAFFLLPIVIGVLIRWPALATRRNRVTILSMLFATALLSPLWWSSVVIILLVACIPWMLAANSSHFRGAWWQPLIATGLGAMVPTMLGLFAAIPGAERTRFDWDSNRFGGHLVDILIASPILNQALPFVGKLREGASLGANFLGIVGGVLAAATVVASVTLISRRRLVLRSRILLGLSVVSVLLFVVGGLGNLQAAIGVIVGEPSPARGWGRLVILLALLGGAWVMHWLTSRPPLFATTPRKVRVVFYELALAGIVGVWAADWVVAIPNLVRITPAAQLAEAEAVTFITNTLQPCPVAQLPVDSNPNERMWIPEAAEVAYRGFIPYVLAPDFSWSYGGDATAEASAPTARVGSDVTDVVVDRLASDGYCALLFDKRMSELAQANGVGLPGLTLATTTTPAFEDGRFAVFILDPTMVTQN